MLKFIFYLYLFFIIPYSLICGTATENTKFSNNVDVSTMSSSKRVKSKKKIKKSNKKRKLVLQKKRKKVSRRANVDFKAAIKANITQNPEAKETEKTLKNQFEDIYIKNEENFIVFYAKLKEELSMVQNSNPLSTKSDELSKSFDVIIEKNIVSKVKLLCLEVGKEFNVEIIEKDKAIGYWQKDSGDRVTGVSLIDTPSQSGLQTTQGDPSAVSNADKKFIILMSAEDFASLVAEVKNKVLKIMGETVISCAKDGTLQMTENGIINKSQKIIVTKDKLEQFMLNPDKTSIDVGEKKVTVKEIEKNDNAIVISNLLPNELRNIIQKHGMIEMILIMSSFFERFNCSLWDVFGVLFNLMKDQDFSEENDMIYYKKYPIMHKNFFNKKKDATFSCVSVFKDYKNELNNVLKFDNSGNKYKKFKAYIKNILSNLIADGTKKNNNGKNENMRIRSFYYLTAVCGLLVYVKNILPNTADSVVKEILKSLNEAFFDSKSGKDRFKNYALEIANPVYLKDFDSIQFTDIINNTLLYNKDFSNKNFDKSNFQLSCDQMILTYYLDLFTMMIQIETEDSSNNYFLNENIDSYFQDYYQKYLESHILKAIQPLTLTKINDKNDSIATMIAEFFKTLFSDFSVDSFDKDGIKKVRDKIDIYGNILAALKKEEYYKDVLNNRIARNVLFVSDWWSLVKDFYCIQNNNKHKVIYSKDQPQINVKKTLFQYILLDVFDKIKNDLNYLEIESNYQRQEGSEEQSGNLVSIKENISNGYKKLILNNLTKFLKTLQDENGISNDVDLEELYDMVVNTTLSFQIIDEISTKIQNENDASKQKKDFINMIQKTWASHIIQLEMLCMQLIEIIYLNPFNSKSLNHGVLYGAIIGSVAAVGTKVFSPGTITSAADGIASGIKKGVGEFVGSQYGLATIATLSALGLMYKYRDTLSRNIKKIGTGVSNLSLKNIFSSSSSLSNASF